METSAHDREHTPTADDGFLSTEQVVDLLGLSAPTVRKLVKVGHLPAHRPPGGRKLLFLADEVRQAVATWGRGISPIERAARPDDSESDAAVLTIDADGEERWERLDSLRPPDDQSR